MRIFIVDDDQDCVFLTKRALRKIRPDCVLEVANDGKQAMELLAKLDPFQLILLDLKLPGMGGIEMLQLIKEQKSLEHIPVVVLSSSTMDSDIQQSYDAGASKYIHKSHDFGEFTQSLKEVISTIS